MASRKLAPAFALVRNLLQDQPRSFQALLSAGVAQSASTSAGPAGQTASLSSTSTAEAAALRKGKAREAASATVKETRVPQDHPFVSATFLKNRILPVLESQHLIHLAPAKSAGSGGTIFKWSLGPPPSRLSAPAALPKWDVEEHWQRLLDGTHPGQTAGEYAVHKAMEKSLRRDEAAQSGKLRLGEKEMREWAGRTPGLSTRGERAHLNVRRERVRGRKERERIALGGGGLRSGAAPAAVKDGH